MWNFLFTDQSVSLLHCSCSNPILSQPQSTRCSQLGELPETCVDLIREIRRTFECYKYCAEWCCYWIVQIKDVLVCDLLEMSRCGEVANTGLCLIKEVVTVPPWEHSAVWLSSVSWWGVQSPVKFDGSILIFVLSMSFSACICRHCPAL